MSAGLKETLAAYGMRVSVEADKHVSSTRPHSTHVMVVLGRPLTAGHISKIGQTLADYDANIDTISGIADYPVTGVEFNITVSNPARRRCAAPKGASDVDTRDWRRYCD